MNLSGEFKILDSFSLFLLKCNSHSFLTIKFVGGICLQNFTIDIRKFEINHMLSYHFEILINFVICLFAIKFNILKDKFNNLLLIIPVPKMPHNSLFCIFFSMQTFDFFILIIPVPNLCKRLISLYKMFLEPCWFIRWYCLMHYEASMNFPTSLRIRLL